MSARAPAKSLSLLETVKASSEFLARHGVESPRLNAEHLAAHVLGKKNRIDIYLEFDRPLGPRELEPLRALVQRRSKGEPLQHLLGTVEFFGREFLSDARALIPRPETEQLVELALARIPATSSGEFVDVGTGSGIIALTVAAERPAVRLSGLDRSAEALALARSNAQKLELSSRVDWRESDLLSAVTQPLDGIIANLPYIPSGDLVALAREVQHDPRAALDGGGDGLALIGRLVSEARVRLKRGGWIELEIGHDQARRVEKMLAAMGFEDIRARSDLAGIERFLSGSLPA